MLLSFNSETSDAVATYHLQQWSHWIDVYVQNRAVDTETNTRQIPSVPRWLLSPRIMELSKLSLREKLLPVGPRRHRAIARQWAAEVSSEWASVTGKKGRTRKGGRENRSFLGISTAEPPCFRDLHLPDGPFGSLPHCPPLFTASQQQNLSICCLVPTQCLGTPRRLYAELRGSGTVMAVGADKGRQLGGRKVGWQSLTAATCHA